MTLYLGAVLAILLGGLFVFIALFFMKADVDEEERIENKEYAEERAKEKK